MCSLMPSPTETTESQWNSNVLTADACARDTGRDEKCDGGSIPKGSVGSANILMPWTCHVTGNSAIGAQARTLVTGGGRCAS
jgi:hypothetical protein